MSKPQPVSRAECEANVERMLERIEKSDEFLGREIKEIKTILRGSEGRNGLVKDVNLINQKIEIYQRELDEVKAIKKQDFTFWRGAIVGLVSAVISALITNYFMLQMATGG